MYVYTFQIIFDDRLLSKIIHQNIYTDFMCELYYSFLAMNKVAFFVTFAFIFVFVNSVIHNFGKSDEQIQGNEYNYYNNNDFYII